MEKIFEEILYSQNRCLKSCSKRALFLKAMYLFSTLISIVYPKPYVLLTKIFINVTLLLVIKLYRTLVYVTVTWLLTTAMITCISIFTGTFTNHLLNILVYVYVSTLSILFFVSTTPPKQLIELMGLNPLTLSYLMLRNVFEEIREILSACKAKGWADGLNPISYVRTLYNVVIVMGFRMKTAEESVKSRGLD